MAETQTQSHKHQYNSKSQPSLPPTRTRRTPYHPRPRCWARPRPQGRDIRISPPTYPFCPIDTRPSKEQVYSVSANYGHLVRVPGDGTGGEVIVRDGWLGHRSRWCSTRRGRLYWPTGRICA
ncbi:hypothetical protein FIBSPDRAFT_319376 [Athelia psychrophila]|uniref:Uncharacterized protein n=1 Tax=Athelia psychrophila TaxID=1759441 RepID=A0A166QFL6_9AGAM|nr:hypothetical protein FIBSPDRAFT_319376 [Fibularhizoctonia sp. CBS 109695]